MKIAFEQFDTKLHVCPASAVRRPTFPRLDTCVLIFICDFLSQRWNKYFCGANRL